MVFLDLSIIKQRIRMNRILGILIISLGLFSCSTEDTCQTCTVYEESSVVRTDLASQGFQFADLFESEADIVGSVCGDNLNDIKSMAMSQSVTTPLGNQAIVRTRVVCE